MRKLLVFIASLMLAVPAFAQASAITFTGEISADGEQTIVVNGLTVDTSAIDAATQAQLLVGASVTVTGTLDNGVVTASIIIIEVVVMPTATPVPANSGTLVGGYVVVFTGSSYDGSSTSFTYILTGTGQGDALTGITLSLPSCEADLTVSGTAPAEGVTVAGSSITWALAVGASESVTLNLTLAGEVETAGVNLSLQSASASASLIIIGPGCPDDDDQATPEVTAEATVVVTPDDDNDDNDNDDNDNDDNGDAAELPTIIIIEGPVQAINVNIVTIFNIQIELDQNDPALTVIQVDDIIRVEAVSSPQINIFIAQIFVTIIEVNVTEININPPGPRPPRGGGGDNDNDNDNDNDDDD